MRRERRKPKVDCHEGAAGPRSCVAGDAHRRRNSLDRGRVCWTCPAKVESHPLWKIEEVAERKQTKAFHG